MHIENIEDVTNEQLGGVMSGDLTLYAEALDVPDGQLPPEVTLEYVVRLKRNNGILQHLMEDKLNIQVRWAVFPKFVIFGSDEWHNGYFTGAAISNSVPYGVTLEEYRQTVNPEENPPRLVDIPLLLNKISEADVGMLFINCHGTNPDCDPGGIGNALFERYEYIEDAQMMLDYYQNYAGIHCLVIKPVEDPGIPSDYDYYIAFEPLFFAEYCQLASRSFVHLAMCYSSYEDVAGWSFAEMVLGTGISCLGYPAPAIVQEEIEQVSQFIQFSFSGIKTVGELFEEFWAHVYNVELLYYDDMAPHHVLATEPALFRVKTPSINRKEK